MLEHIEALREEMADIRGRQEAIATNLGITLPPLPPRTAHAHHEP
ncbi:hypothetical protein [Streptomyces sp. RPT161]|nr:hypothetical protein [Streptomyces sp. RPT161]